MNLLAFDTGTGFMSIAVQKENQLWEHTSEGGAQSSTTLIPVILDLLSQADLKLSDLDAICFGNGPGSFTGLRTACSVAQGLALGANVPVLPVDSLLAVAEEIRFTTYPNIPKIHITAVIDARMNEHYIATYAFDSEEWQTVESAHLVAATPDRRIEALPTASAILRLAPQFIAQGDAVAAQNAYPRYIRDKVAQTTAERMAEKNARSTL